MTTDTNILPEAELDAGYETSKFALGVGITIASLLGIWGTACLISALSSNGPVALVKSYFNAISGL